MAFKLDKGEIKRRDDYRDDLIELRSKLMAEVTAYNAAAETAKDAINLALDAYNEKLEEVRGFAFDIANQAEAEIDDKSEKWQEGDKGQAATEWKDAWENAELGDVEIEFPDDLELDEPDQPEILEALPEEASE